MEPNSQPHTIMEGIQQAQNDHDPESPKFPQSWIKALEDAQSTPLFSETINRQYYPTLQKTEKCSEGFFTSQQMLQIPTRKQRILNRLSDFRFRLGIRIGSFIAGFELASYEDYC